MERKRFFLLIGLLAAICICLLIYCNQRADTVPATKTKSGEDIIMTSGRGAEDGKARGEGKVEIMKNGLMLAIILLAGMALILLSKIGEKVTRVSYFVWSVITIAILMSAMLLARENLLELWCGESGSFLLWASILSCFGFVVVRYAAKYKKQILGIYAMITGAVAAAAYIGNPFTMVTSAVRESGIVPLLEEPFRLLYPPLLFIGYTAMAILCSLALVAEKRPIKVKRWIRISYLFLGLGLMARSVFMYQSLSWGTIWSWKASELVPFISWILLCAFLHGKKSYTKEMCLMPFLLAILGAVLTRMKWPVLAGVIGAVIAACGIWLLLYKWRQGIGKITGRDNKELFRMLSYGYAGLLLIGVIVQVLFRKEAWQGFYNIVTILYAVAAIALFLWNQERMAQLKYVAVLVWNTLMAMLMILLFPKLDTMYLVLFWICLFPVTFFFIQWRTAYKSPYMLSHLLVSAMILGIVASCGFSAEYIEVCSVDSGSMMVRGEEIARGNVNKEKTIRIHKVTGDYVVKEVESGAGTEGELAVTYESKPFIYLFWIGGFGLFFYFAWRLIRRV